jgi:hypothetical protein
MTPRDYHWVEMEFDGESCVTARFICVAPRGADCRMWCNEGCDYDDEEHEEHELWDQGSCRIVDHLNDTEYQDSYHSMEPVTPHSGPIIAEWDDPDTIYWRYDSIRELELFCRGFVGDEKWDEYTAEMRENVRALVRSGLERMTNPAKSKVLA